MAKNMKVQLELTAKDTASPVLNQAAKTTEKAFKKYRASGTTKWQCSNASSTESSECYRKLKSENRTELP